MAQPPETFVTAAIQSVVQEIRVASLAKQVRNYNGEGTSKFYQWLSDMDQLSNAVDSDRMCVLATLTLGGPAGLFVARLTKAAITWTDLRKNLRERYGEAEDPRIAREKLRQIKQRNGEAIQNFSERLRAAANDLFDDIDSDEAQGLIVDTFQRGLRDDRLARVLIRKNCKNLDGLEKLAIDEQQSDKIFHLYRRDETEPMEVDMVRKDDEVQELKKTVSDLQKKLEQAQQTPTHYQPPPPTRQQYHPRAQRYTNPQQYNTRAQYTQQPRPPPRQQYNRPPPPHMYADPPPPPQNNHRWTPDGRPICSSCGRIGHVGRFCRSGN